MTKKEKELDLGEMDYQQRINHVFKLHKYRVLSQKNNSDSFLQFIFVDPKALAGFLVLFGFLFSGIGILIYVILGLKALVSLLGAEQNFVVEKIQNDLIEYLVTGVLVSALFLGAGFNLPSVPVSVSDLIFSILAGV